MDLDKLTQAVAQHLAGRPVRIRWQPPAVATASGQALQGPGGVAVVDINPDLPQADRYKTLLHELAHIARGDHLAAQAQAYTRPPASVDPTPTARAAWRGDPREAAANELAARWAEFAEKRADYHLNRRLDLSGIEALLLALLDYQGG